MQSNWCDLLNREVDEAEAYSAISALQFAAELITLAKLERQEDEVRQREADYESGRKWLMHTGEC